MKRSRLYLLTTACLTGVFLLSLGGCNKCKETGTVTIGEASQNFSVRYLTPGGINYIESIFNLGNVSVLWADYSPFHYNPQFSPAPYIEDFSDGLLGPIPFTAFPGELAQLGVYHNYKFVIKADTFGWDTIDVEFLPTADECKEYWAEITYKLNGDILAEHQDKEITEIVITR